MILNPWNDNLLVVWNLSSVPICTWYIWQCTVLSTVQQQRVGEYAEQMYMGKYGSIFHDWKSNFL